MSGYLNQLAALTLNQVQPVQPRLASRFETPVDRDGNDNIKLDVAQELPVSAPPIHPQFSMVSPSDNLISKEVETAPTLPVSVPPIHPQPSMVSASDHSISQKVETAPTGDRMMRNTNGHDQPQASEQTGLRTEKLKLRNDQQAPVLSQSVSAINQEQASRAVPPVNKPVAAEFQETHKNPKPIESTHTRIERLQEHFFTETTHKELIIKAVTSLDSGEKNEKAGEISHSVPVKPANIAVRSAQSTIESLPVKQAGNQHIPFAQSDTETTPAPTIQVTIGRIEIRATQTAEKSTAKPRAASTAMSLDDYLSRRNGGRI